MKKSLLALVPLSLLALASCSIIGNLPIDDEEGDDTSYNQGSEWAEPSIEALVKKYSGFEVTYHYTYTDDIIKVGGKGNTYWYATFKASDESETISNMTITTVEGTKYTNKSFSAGYWMNLDAEENMAALISDSNYIGFAQHGGILEEYKYTKATINGESAKKYAVANMEVYVSEADGYTMQIDYADGDSIKHVKTTKGSQVEIPTVEDEEEE